MNNKEKYRALVAQFTAAALEGLLTHSISYEKDDNKPPDQQRRNEIESLAESAVDFGEAVYRALRERFPIWFETDPFGDDNPS